MSRNVSQLVSMSRDPQDNFPYLSNLWQHPLSLKITPSVFKTETVNVYRPANEVEKLLLGDAEFTDGFGGFKCVGQDNFANILQSIKSEFSFVLQAVFFPHKIMEEGLVWSREDKVYYVSSVGWVASVVMCGYDVPKAARVWYEVLPEDFFVPRQIVQLAAPMDHIHTLSVEESLVIEDVDGSVCYGDDYMEEGNSVVLCYNDFYSLMNVDGEKATDDMIPTVVGGWSDMVATSPICFEVIGIEEDSYIYEMNSPVTQWDNLSDFTAEGDSTCVTMTNHNLLPRSAAPSKAEVLKVKWTFPYPPSGLVVPKKRGSEVIIFAGKRREPLYTMTAMGNCFDIEISTIGYYGLMSIVTGLPTATGDVWMPTSKQLWTCEGSRVIFAFYYGTWKYYSSEMTEIIIADYAGMLSSHLVGVLKQDVCFLPQQVVWASARGTPGFFLADHALRRDQDTPMGFRPIAPEWTTYVKLKKKHHNSDLMCAMAEYPYDIWFLLSKLVSIDVDPDYVNHVCRLIHNFGKAKEVMTWEACPGGTHVVQTPLLDTSIPHTLILNEHATEEASFIPQCFQGCQITPLGRLFQASVGLAMLVAWDQIVFEAKNMQGAHRMKWVAVVAESEAIIRLATLVHMTIDDHTHGFPLASCADQAVIPLLIECDLSTLPVANFMTMGWKKVPADEQYYGPQDSSDEAWDRLDRFLNDNDAVGDEDEQ